MSSSPVDQLIKFRLQQAKESIAEAETLYLASFLRGAINRSYYAMFYAVLGLIVLRQETTSKHSGVVAFFDREFVKTGIFPKDLSKSLHLAFQRRQENDYGNVFSIDDEEAQQALKEAKIFIDSVEIYIDSASKHD